VAFKDKLQGTVPFKLYLIGIVLENIFVLIKRDQPTNCIIKLYSINSMTTADSDFWNESMMWIENAMQKSILISGSSQKESFKLFNLLNKKVRYLIERIERSNTLYSPF